VCACAQRNAPGLREQASHVTTVVCAALRDAFPEAVKAGASGAAALCAALPAEDVRAHADALASALGAALAHRHAAVRSSALRGLEALGLAAASAQLVTEKLLPLLRPLFFDAQPTLRAAAVAAAAAWLATVRQPMPPGEAAASARAFGLAEQPRLPLAPHLLPLLLLATSDEQPAVAIAATAAVEAAANAWATAAGGQGNDTEMADVADDEDNAPCAADSGLWLPPPYAARPSARARAMAAALLPALVGPALADLREWTPGVRSAAARLLLAALLHAEGAAVAPLPKLLPGIAAGCGDDDAGTAGRCVSAAHVLGARTPPAAWLPLAAEAATSAVASQAGRTCAVVVLAALLRTAGGRMRPQDAAAAAAALASPALRAAAAEHAPLRAQAAAAARNLALSAGAALAPSVPALFHLIVSLRGAGGGIEADADGAPRQPSADDVAADARADEALAALAAAAGRDPASLYADHAGAALAAMQADAKRTAGGAPAVAALGALLAHAPGDALAPHGGAIAALLANACAPERPPGVRLAALRSLGALADDASGRGGAALRGDAAATLLRDTLPPLLAWRAGRAAAACRFAALAAAEALLRRRAASDEDVAAALRFNADAPDAGRGLLRGLGSCLEEDYYAETRLCAAMALHAALRYGGTSGVRGKQRAWLAQQLARRLDDARDDVRCAAAGALAAFCAALPPALPAGTADAALLADEWPEAEGAHLLAAMLPHLDDAQPVVRAAAAAAACAAAARHPRAAAELVPPARAAARHPEAYDGVISASRQLT